MERGTASEVRWFEGSPTYVLHFLNAYEEGDEIVMDGYHMARLGIQMRPSSPASPPPCHPNAPPPRYPSSSRRVAPRRCTAAPPLCCRAAAPLRCLATPCPASPRLTSPPPGPPRCNCDVIHEVFFDHYEVAKEPLLFHFSEIGRTINVPPRGRSLIYIRIGLELVRLYIYIYMLKSTII